MRSIVLVAVTVAMLAFLARCSNSSSTPAASSDAGTTDSGANTVADSATAATDTGTGTEDSSTAVDSSTVVSADSGEDAGTCTLPSGLTVVNATCTACLQASCCGAVLTCYDDTTCLTLNNCLANCQTGELPNDGGAYDASNEGDGGALSSCENTCLSGASSTTLGEVQAQLGCINPAADGGAGPCETACAQ